jgi:Raf kinase inhibitor-like YbhB/YbcL family protein
MVAVLILAGAGCIGSPKTIDQVTPPKPQPPLSLTSPAFADGQAIPDKYTCKGQDFSPPVVFANPPAGTISYALIMEDKTTSFDHWILYNMAPGVGGIAEGDVAPGAAGTTSANKTVYQGPCPPEGETHTYDIGLYAIRGVIDLQDGATKDEVKAQMEGKILKESHLTGTYTGK